MRARALVLAFAVTTSGNARISVPLQPQMAAAGHESQSPAGESAPIEITGLLVSGTLSGSDRPPCSFRFQLEARAPIGRRLWVHYAGCTLPDTMTQGVEVTARGYLRNRHLEATSLGSR